MSETAEDYAAKKLHKEEEMSVVKEHLAHMRKQAGMDAERFCNDCTERIKHGTKVYKAFVNPYSPRYNQTEERREYICLADWEILKCCGLEREYDNLNTTYHALLLSVETHEFSTRLPPVKQYD